MLEKYLVCTDLDRTLIPNGPAPESPEAEGRFAALASRPDVTLAYVSGRHRELVDNAIAEYHLPRPDFVLGDVGTTIYRVSQDNGWQQDESWEHAIGQDWAGLTHGDMLTLLSGLPGLRLQEPSKQNRFKLSYYIDTDNDLKALGGVAHGLLEKAGVRARLVWSKDDISGEGLLDVLPSSASKRHAIEALMEIEGFLLQQTVFCGDSGNDLEVLASPIPAVLVANARPEIKLQAGTLAEEAGCIEQLYVARGGFLGMNGNYRGGMLEGIAHFHAPLRDWLLKSAADPAGATV
ncbi:HAD-IIB family hydrolase [Pseudomonadota bacterium]